MVLSSCFLVSFKSMHICLPALQEDNLSEKKGLPPFSLKIEANDKGTFKVNDAKIALISVKALLSIVC